MDGCLACVHLKVAQLVPRPIHGYFFSHWQSPHWFPDLWRYGCYGRKCCMQATRMASVSPNGKLKAILHSWRDCRDLCHEQRLEGCRGVIPTTSRFNPPIWPLQRSDEFWILENNSEILANLSSDKPNSNCCSRHGSFTRKSQHPLAPSMQLR